MTPEGPHIDSREFRSTVGLFATGVTVVATEVDGEIYAMTANALTSLSLDPTLILVCIDNTSETGTFLAKGNPFCISILSEAQQPLSAFYATMWEEEEPPPHTWLSGQGGPRLEGAIAAIGCVFHETFEGGDHWILVGRVVELFKEEQPPNPLLFYRGRYAQLAD